MSMSAMTVSMILLGVVAAYVFVNEFILACKRIRASLRKNDDSQRLRRHLERAAHDLLQRDGWVAYEWQFETIAEPRVVFTVRLIRYDPDDERDADENVQVLHYFDDTPTAKDAQ